MSNDNTNPLDILTQDLSDVKTDMPLLVEAIYDLKVHEIKREPSKDGAKENINVVLHTTSNASTTSREVVHAGFPIFHTISITPTDKYSVDQIKRKCAEFTQAVGVRSMEPLDQHLNRVVRAKIVIDPERTDEKTGKRYDARNSVKSFLKVS